MLISETFINRTEGYRFGESEPYEPFTDRPGEIYRFCQGEYGRCVGKVYIDTTDGGARAIGWIFVGRAKYEDTQEPYLREVWVTLHEKKPTRTIEHHYHTIN